MAWYDFPQNTRIIFISICLIIYTLVRQSTRQPVIETVMCNWALEAAGFLKQKQTLKAEWILFYSLCTTVKIAYATPGSVQVIKIIALFDSQKIVGNDR